MSALNLVCWRRLVTALIALPLCAGSVVAFAQAIPGRAETPTFKVGDRWKYEQRDYYSGVKEWEFVRVVTSVNDAEIAGTENAGTFRMTPYLAVVDSTTRTSSDTAKLVNFPIEVGKKWDHAYLWTRKDSGARGSMRLAVSVVGYERLRVSAGEFDAFKIVATGSYSNQLSGSSGRSAFVYWFAPAARNIIRTEYNDGRNSWVHELTELTLQP